MEAKFKEAGAPGPPPNLPHDSKWKIWLSRIGEDPTVDSLAVVGRLIEEFMDLPPAVPNVATDLLGSNYDPLAGYRNTRERVLGVLKENGLQYFRGGRVAWINGGQSHADNSLAVERDPGKPTSIQALLEVIVRGLPRAIYPLEHRRKGAPALSFSSEYDIQDLLHSHLRPWIEDVRPEEFTPSYAGSSARMDFLLPRYSIVLETKRVRNTAHAARLGDELIIDIEHYRRHTRCKQLWCVVYDPDRFIRNPIGLINDLEGTRSTPDGEVVVRVFVLPSSHRT